MTITDTSPRIVTFAAAREWATEHGFDANDIAAAEIVFDPHTRARTGFVALVELTVYRRNEMGSRYLDRETGHAAIDSVTVPLRSWPALSEPASNAKE